MRFDRNSTAIIFDCDRIVFMQSHMNGIAIPCHGFVDAVVDHFINQLMQTIEPVSPIYMPGRSRTACSPSRTVIELAVYSLANLGSSLCIVDMSFAPILAT